MSTYQYARFDVDTLMSGRWIVSTPGRDQQLGEVRWYPSFASYTFWPASPFIVLGAGVLREIANFIDTEMAKRQ